MYLVTTTTHNYTVQSYKEVIKPKSFYNYIQIKKNGSQLGQREIRTYINQFAMMAARSNKYILNYGELFAFMFLYAFAVVIFRNYGSNKKNSLQWLFCFKQSTWYFGAIFIVYFISSLANDYIRMFIPKILLLFHFYSTSWTTSLVSGLVPKLKKTLN